MYGDLVLVVLGIDFLVLGLQLYLLNKDTEIYLDLLFPVALFSLNVGAYLNTVVYVAGENVTKINNYTTIITPIYKVNPYSGLYWPGFLISFVSAILVLIKIFYLKKGVWDLFD